MKITIQIDFLKTRKPFWRNLGRRHLAEDRMYKREDPPSDLMHQSIAKMIDDLLSIFHTKWDKTVVQGCEDKTALIRFSPFQTSWLEKVALRSLHIWTYLLLLYIAHTSKMKSMGMFTWNKHILNHLEMVVQGLVRIQYWLIV